MSRERVLAGVLLNGDCRIEFRFLTMLPIRTPIQSMSILGFSQDLQLFVVPRVRRNIKLTNPGIPVPRVVACSRQSAHAWKNKIHSAL